MYLWFFDFDETITIEHTNSHQNASLDPENLAQLLKNIRNPDFLREFFRKCAAKGDKIFITTKQTNKKLIGAYMHALLSNDWKEIIAGMCCINGHPYCLPGKFGHIIRITRQYWNNPSTNSFRVPDVRKYINLVDDSKQNCDAAVHERLNVVWAEKHKDDYLNDLNRIEQARINHPYLEGFIKPNEHDVDRNMDLEEISDINSAKTFLGQHVFNLVNFNYENKSTYINTIISAFKQLIEYQIMQPVNQKYSQTEIINQLCDLYDHINQPQNKDKINIHKHPWLDNKLNIVNTSSWQKMVGVIREMSLVQLLGESEGLQLASRADFLYDYCYKDLFREHRDNGFFRKKESETSTVEKINQKMQEYQNLVQGGYIKKL